MLCAGDVLDRKYRIVCLVGEGGMGAVYEAEHTFLGRRVAIKVLAPQFAQSTEAVKRFHREAQAAARIGHENICEVTDIGQSEAGLPYIVMPLLQGRPLTAVIAESAPLPIGRTVDIASQILEALQAAHAAGIVHRDMKPDNVFLTRVAGREDFVKVLDFGISKVKWAGSGGGTTDSVNLTQAGTVLGTPAYMSPEQARGESEVDARADIWAVGVMVYEMLTQRQPFEGTNYNQIVYNVTSAPIPSLRSIRPGITREFEAAVTGALERDLRRRHATAQAFSDALMAAWMTVGESGFALPPAAPSPPPAPGEVSTASWKVPGGCEVSTPAVPAPPAGHDTEVGPLTAIPPGDKASTAAPSLVSISEKEEDTEVGPRPEPCSVDDDIPTEAWDAGRAGAALASAAAAPARPSPRRGRADPTPGSTMAPATVSRTGPAARFVRMTIVASAVVGAVAVASALIAIFVSRGGGERPSSTPEERVVEAPAPGRLIVRPDRPQPPGPTPTSLGPSATNPTPAQDALRIDVQPGPRQAPVDSSTSAAAPDVLPDSPFTAVAMVETPPIVQTQQGSGTNTDAGREVSLRPSGHVRDAGAPAADFAEEIALVGTLSVFTVPTTDVTVDGIPFGRCPFTRRELFAGRHRIQLVNEAQGIRHEEVLVIAAGRETVVRRTAEQLGAVPVAPAGATGSGTGASGRPDAGQVAAASPDAGVDAGGIRIRLRDYGGRTP